MSAYTTMVSIQKLFAIMVALTVLLAPAVTRAGEASAAVPDHHAQMMKTGHCDMPAGDAGDQDGAPQKSCCVSMCMAIAVAPPTPDAHEALQDSPAVFSERTFELGPPPEIATPPPRSA